MLNYKFEFKKDDKRLSHVLKKLEPKHFFNAIDPFLKKWAERYTKMLKETIDDQTLDWPALADATVDKKGHENAWWETRVLVKHFDINKELNLGLQKYVAYYMGLDRSKKYTRHGHNDLTYAKLADILEYGATNKQHGWHIPPRPLFKPVGDQWWGLFGPAFENFVTNYGQI